MTPSLQVSDHSLLDNDCCILLHRTAVAADASAETAAAAPQSSFSLEELNRREEEEVIEPHILPMDEEEVPTMMMPLYYSWPVTSGNRALPEADTDAVMASRSEWGAATVVDSAPVVNRRVRFGGIQSMKRIESVRDMTGEELSDRWYTKAELLAFKQAARDLCKGEQRQLLLLGGGTPSSLSVDEETSSTRGMDVYFPSRQRHQAKYIWHVLQAFHHIQHQQQQQQQQPQKFCGSTSNGGTDRYYYVALLCEKWSSKVSLQAAERAMQDFYDAYFPSCRVRGTSIGGGCRTDSSRSIRNHKRAAAPY